MKLDRKHIALLADQHQGLFKAADLPIYDPVALVPEQDTLGINQPK